MSHLTLEPKTKPKGLLRTIILSGLIVATLDITAAIIQTTVNGRNPVKMFQFIASGVYGMEAFSGGARYAFYGLVFHYGIALTWTFLFFIAYPRTNVFTKNKLTAGVLYGIFVWLMMTQIVLPLSNTPSLPFNWLSAFTGMLILVLALGLPLSFLATRYYSKSITR